MAWNSVNTAMGSGGGGGNNSALIQQLIQSLQGQTNAANTQNLSQYNNLLSTVKGTTKNVNNIYQQQLGLVGTQGQTALAQQDIAAKNNVGKADQDLVSRGLDNTTIRSSVLSGVDRNNALAKTGIQEGIDANKLNLMGQQAQGQMQLGQMQGDALLSRQNQTPDMSQYLSLIAQLGQNQGRSSGGGMAPGVYINGRPAGVPGQTPTIFR